MDKKKLMGGCFAAIAMSFLILDSGAALSGANEGVTLCVRTVIPSLFPFFFLSIWMTEPLMGQRIAPLGPLADIMGMPKGTSSLLISAFLGGYPAGAQAVGQSYREGCLKKETAERLLAFTNNAGPAFIFGMVAQMFSEPFIPWLLWGIHILSAVCVGLVTPGKCTEKASIPGRSSDLSQTMDRSIRVMATVCGWVVIFRIMTAFLDKWILPDVPPPVRVVITGLLELSNGCCGLEAIVDPKLRFVICSGMLAIGGLCVTMQTASVVKGLRMKYYIIGKLLQCVLSLIMAGAFMYRSWAVLPVALIPIFIFCIRTKNYSGNPSSLRV